MAYNPFDFFRKNQKIMFAGLTVMIMFMFVLSFGRGDFFDWFPRWLGGKKARGEVLAVIDGDKFQESEASRIRARRIAANQFMMTAAERAKGNLLTYVKDNTSKVSPENRAAVQGVVDNYNIVRSLNGLSPELRQMYMQQVPQFANARVAFQNSIGRVDALAQDSSAKPDDRDIATAVRKYILLSELSSFQDKHYFLNQPNRSAKDAIDYTLWLKKADQLKIRFRTGDVDRMLDQEFLQLKADEREKIFLEMLKETRGAGMSKDDTLDAIGDEFRVRLAQVAVLGLPDVRGDGANGYAPLDYYEFFRTETSPADYEVISIPVDNFVSRVQSQPTETELREIFNKAKNTEADPSLPKIGIKKGRELRLGWLEVTGKEPFYATAAADALVKAEIAAKMAGLLEIPFGVGAIGNALSTGAFAVEDPALQGAYDSYRNQQVGAVADWFSYSQFNRPLPIDASFANPQVVAATVGLAANPVAVPFAVANGALLSADGAERKQRLFAGLAMLAPPTLVGTAVLVQHAGNAAAANQGLPKTLPLAAVKAKLVTDSRESLRYRLAQLDIRNFQDELIKINKDEDKEKAQKEAEGYIARFASPVSNWLDREGKPQLGRGWKLGASTGFYDQYTIGNDPGLAPLKARLEIPHAGTPVKFGRQFFYEDDGRTAAPRPTTGLFTPLPYPEMSGQRFPQPNPYESQFLVWRSAEVPAEAAKDFDNARGKCIEIWKRQKARELARQAAEEFRTKTANLGQDFFSVSLKLKDVAKQFREQFQPLERDRVREFAIRNVARTVVVSEPGVTFAKPYTLTEPDIEYPTQKILEDLVANRTKPISTSIVMLDRPETTFYVAVLLQRTNKTEMEFNRLVYSPDPDALRTNALVGEMLSRFRQEAGRQAREEAVEMLKAEFNYEKETENKEKLIGTGE